MNEDFTFSHVTGGFDTHIQKSIRNYDQLLDDVVALSRYFVEDKTNIVDIGCSTGKLTDMLFQGNYDHCKNANYTGVEIADGFRKALEARKKFKFFHGDVQDYIFENCSLVTSLFTLQFIPKKDRQKVLTKIYQGLNLGGAFIFAEKITCDNPMIQDMLTFNYYDFKNKNFVSNEIMQKEKILRHMLKPNTWDEIKTQAMSAGFSKIDRFWQNHTFIGAIAIK